MGGPDRARTILLDAIAQRLFPAAVVDVGSSRGSLWRDALGTLTFSSGSADSADSADPASARLATPFDLASLTKVVATTTVVMELVATHAVRLDERLAESFPEWRGDDRAAATVQDLLEHSSGLPARLIDPPPASAREFEHDISVIPLAYATHARSIYSDLGFILLGRLAERRGARSLSAQFDDLIARFAAAEPDLSREPPIFRPSGAVKASAAPTRPDPDDVRRGRTLVGDVHDLYAHLLGGVAGHAGLFGTAAAVAAFARLVLRAARGEDQPAPLSAARVAQFVKKTAVPGSSRALGWDTMLPTSSCGTSMSPSAIGHVGYTGTSLWIDPARNRYFVLLTNRAGGEGSLDEMRTVRRAFHDALHDL